MNLLTFAYLLLDSILIFGFRVPEAPILGYFLGIALLALYCVFLGQLTIAAAFLANRKWIDRNNNNMIRFQNLSVHALLSKDKSGYTACNKEANDAFGKVFFMQIALAASSLWPVPFALGWLQIRFKDVEFILPFQMPFFGETVGYTFTFIPMVILVFILFGKVKRHLPLFSRIEKILNEYDRQSEKIITLADIESQHIDNRA